MLVAASLIMIRHDPEPNVEALTIGLGTLGYILHNSDDLIYLGPYV